MSTDATSGSEKGFDLVDKIMIMDTPLPDANYQRVNPRDLFNEAKLLKCWGQLALLVHEGRGIASYLFVEHTNPCSGFCIGLSGHENSLQCLNLKLWVGRESDPKRFSIRVFQTYNSREAYPLLFEGDFTEDFIFDDQGEFSSNFLRFIRSKTFVEGKLC